jgi:hypothetical protein
VASAFHLDKTDRSVSYGFDLGAYDRSRPLVIDPTIVYAGYIGGTGNDVGSGIAVDAMGAAYITGYTDSTEATFPVAVGPDLTHNGGVDAFVAKVSAVVINPPHCCLLCCPSLQHQGPRQGPRQVPQHVIGPSSPSDPGSGSAGGGACLRYLAYRYGVHGRQHDPHATCEVESLDRFTGRLCKTSHL